MRIHLPLCLCLSAAVCAAMLGNATQAGAASVPTTTALAITSGGSAVTTVSSGTVVTLTATVVAGTTPVTVGLVTFCDAAAAHCTDIHIIGTAQLTSAGTATYKFRPGVGSHSYYAVFAGTPNGATAYAGSTSSTAALSVTGMWPSITTLAASPGTTSGTYNLTATVGGNGSTTPTGTVSFLDASSGDSALGSATLGAGTAGVSFLNTSNFGDPASRTAVGDFNGDGIPDLAAADGVDNAVTIMLGNGDGTFTATQASPSTGPFAITTADFNGDGVLDLAVTNYDSDAGFVTVLLGNGDGTFTPGSTVNVGVYPESIAVGDFNGDGVPDLAVANWCGGGPGCFAGAVGTVSVLLGKGDGTFTPSGTASVGYQPVSMVVGDFNGDGIPDLAVLNDCGDSPECMAGMGVNEENTDSTVTVLLGDGMGHFTPAATSPSVGTAAYGIAAGDFNGDGILDLAASSACDDDPNCESNGAVTILTGIGNGTFSSAATIPVTGKWTCSVAVGDFNADGIPDLAVANQESNDLTVLLGDGTGSFTVAVSPYVYQPFFAAIGDFNGDGVSDLAVNGGDGGVSMIVLEAANQTATATASGVVPAASSDLNFEASYPGDSNYLASTSAVTSVNASLMKPAVSVTLSASTITTVQSLVVTVTISGPPGDPAPTGSVTLTGGGYTSPATVLSGGAAVINIPAGALAIGSDVLTISYTPDAASSATYSSSSSIYGVVVNATPVITPTVMVTPIATSILITQALQVNVTVSGISGYPAPTGSVVLTSGGYTSAASVLSGGSAVINIPAGSLAVGSDTLAVNYTPDSTSSAFYSSATGTSAVTVIQAITPTVVVTPLATSILTSQALQVNVSVSGPSGYPTPTGSVTLTGGGYTSTSSALSGGAAAINIPAGSLAVGSDTLIVSYTPDSNSSSVYTSASGTSTVTVADYFATVTVTPLSTSILTTQALQVNVAVSGPSGDATPTGSVTLTSGSYSSGAVTLTGGTAAINIPANSLSAGSDTLTASYTPDSTSSSTYANATGSATVTVTAPNPLPAIGSMSPAVETAGDDTFTLTVNGSDFTSASVVYWGTSALTTTFVSAAQLTASVPASEIASSGTDSISVQNPSPGGGTSNVLQFEVDSSGAGSPSFTQTTATVTAGQSAIYSVTLPNTASAVTASCLNLPSGASCSYSSSANTVTISTASSTPSGSFQVTVVFAETVAGAASSFIFLPILLTPLLLLRKKSTAGKIWFTACLGLVLLVASVGIGCGGGGSSGPPPPPPTHQVTTSGVVTLKVQ